MKHKQNKKPSKKLLVLVALGAILIIGQITFNLYAWQYMRQTHTPAIIPLLTSAIEGLRKPAAVDPKTGDSYFPEARLFTAAQEEGPVLLYNYNGTSDPELSITSKAILGILESRLWSAYSTNGQNEHKALSSIFDVMPGTQACSRGVQIFYTAQEREQFTLEFTKKLNNGKTIYGYTEPSCNQSLEPIVAAAKTLQSY